MIHLDKHAPFYSTRIHLRVGKEVVHADELAHRAGVRRCNNGPDRIDRMNARTGSGPGTVLVLPLASEYTVRWATARVVCVCSVRVRVCSREDRPPGEHGTRCVCARVCVIVFACVKLSETTAKT